MGMNSEISLNWDFQFRKIYALQDDLESGIK